MRIVLARVGVLAVLAVACRGTSPPVPPMASGSGSVTAPAPAPAPPPPPAPAARFPNVPETIAGEHLAWILDVIVNRAGEVTVAEAERRLHAKFRAAVPADKFVAVAKSLVALAPIEVTSVKGSELALVAKLETAKGPLLAVVDVDPATRQLTGLLFKPDASDAPKPTSFVEAIAMTEKLAPRAQLLIAALDRGTCKPLHASSSERPLAIGSAFKLYVLLALADKVLAGKASWDDPREVRDDWKSLPSGITQDDPAGTRHSLRTLAERMISISDNTATDHLLYMLGRKQVEAAMRSTGHASPKRNIPFLGTRELFLFKLGMADDEIERYRKLSADKRRAYLDVTLAGKAPDVTQAAAWQAPRRIDELEWFASSTDLCRAMGTLWKRAQRAAARPLLDVLAKNRGTDLDRTAWPYAGFKGGSEPGVLDLTWLVRRADDAWFVVSLTANSPDGPIDEARSLAIAQGVFALLAKP